ncbi:hypothetical protein BJV82DRAFT_612702 [Fennellomyces sp. T-0311]|nr:hypothetical protein BJV82DRAFT_612702 [Fennellomyces sp. T-0311]
MVVPADPGPKSRKRPIPWDTDSGTDGDGSSMERLIKWILRDNNFRRWRRGVGANNEPITKKSLIDEFLGELQSAGIDYRKTADVQTKVYQLENDFEKSRQWLASNDKPENSALHDASTRETVGQKCKYYYRLEPVFGEFIPFSKDILTRRSTHGRPSKSSTPPASTSAPVAPASAPSQHIPISPRTSSSAPATQSLVANETIQAALTAFVDRLHQPSAVTSQLPLQTVIDFRTTAPVSLPGPPSNGSTGLLPPPPQRYPPHQPPPPPPLPYNDPMPLTATPQCGPENVQSIMGGERIAIEKLRLAERKHGDRMELKKRKLAMLENQSAKELDIKKRKATAEILTAHAQLISELRSLGLPNSEIIDYMKKAEKL